MLRLVLFGHVEIYLDEQPIELATLPDKGVALLCYLALTRTMHRRSTLAGLLWGNKSERRARNNLSIVLNKLGAICDFLKVERREVGWKLDGAATVDVYDFEQCANQLQMQRLDVMQQSAELYRAPLLSNFRLSDEDGARDFLEWLQIQQTRLEQLARHLFHTLTVQQLEAGNATLAIAAAQREMEIDRWREETHRQLMQLYNHAGRREEAIAQFKLCEQILRDELGVEVSAETRQLYDDILAGTNEPLRTRSFTVPFEAPALPTHFVGRATLAITIGEQLQASTSRVCAFVGMGGIGKTTLATFLAHQWRDDFPDGVLWAHAEDDDLVHLLGRWGERFGRDLSHLKSAENRATIIRDLLVEKRILIVLDNLLRADKLRALIPTSGASLLLVTTRQHDIAAALDALIVPVDVLSQEDGVALLREILGEERISAEIHAAETLCQQLECLPLALEIVAQRLRTRAGYRLEMLLTQLSVLQSRLSELKVGDRAVRTSFELSWEMLSAELKRAFCSLAVFRGRSFTPTAFAAAHAQPFTDILLEDLSALSLLTSLDAQRYRQHALLADFAYEKADDFSEQQQRMVAYYVAYAEKFSAEPAMLQVEWHNLTAAVHDAHECADWTRILALTSALSPNIAKLGHYGDARTLLPLACKAADHLDDSISAAHARHNWGIACIEQNDYAEALPLLEQAYQQAQTHDDNQLTSDVMLNLARVAIERGTYEEAHQWLIDAQTLKEQLQDQQGLGTVHYRLARLHFRIGDLGTAQIHCHTAFEHQKKHYLLDYLRTLKLLASIKVDATEYQQALQLCKEAIGLAKTVTNVDLVSSIYFMALVCSIRCEAYTQVEAYKAQCLHAFRQMGAIKSEGLVYYELSFLKVKQNELDQAMQHICRGIELIEQSQAIYPLVLALYLQGHIHHQRQQNDKARACWQRALQLGRPIRHSLIPRIHERLQQL